MFALGIRYLNGFVVATEPDRRERPEWPPHPGRVFMALAAAHFQTGEDPTEREALLWLEAMREPPAIRAGLSMPREAVTQYVPVNDKAGPAKAMLQTLPLARDRQPRTFAHAWLEDDTVYLSWPEVEIAQATREALSLLCGKVARIGHSSSLVQVWLAEQQELPAANWLPDDDSPQVQLRLASPGTLEDLERRYDRDAVEAFADLEVSVAESTGRARTAARKQLKERFPGGRPPAQLRPSLSVYQGYREQPVSGSAADPEPAHTVFDTSLTVLTLERVDGPYSHLDVSHAPHLIQRWREELMHDVDAIPDATRRLISGLDPQGLPLDEAHLAFLPLAFVGHAHADGRLLGMGLAVPTATSEADRRAALRRVGQLRQLDLGQLGLWKLQSTSATELRWNLSPRAWTCHPHGAQLWATVTPIAFDRHPKAKERSAYHVEVARMIAEGCVHVGLPRPSKVDVTAIAAHEGAPPSRDFPRLRRKDGSERRHTHAILEFDQPVRGPVIIGAGRYRGYGLCRPIQEQEQQRA